MEEKTEKIKQLYVITEMTYIDKNSNIPEDELFPVDWYTTTNYIKKIEILGEAIKKDVLIKDTEKFKEYQGVSRTLR